MSNFVNELKITAMSELLKVFAQRLKQARILKKMSMDQLVAKIGGIITKQAISKYETAKMMPNSTVLVALATALDVDADYFFRPFTFDVNELKVSFRKKSDTSVKDVNSLKVQIQDEVERYLEVEEILGKDKQPAPQMGCGQLSNPSQMREQANKLREEWKLGNDAIGNVQDVLEAHGIKVIFTEAPLGFDGVSGVINGKDYIVVLNKRQEHVERRRFTTMHELGHLLFDKHFSSVLTLREKEKLCDAFASEMLLPSVVLQGIFSPGEKISASEVRQLQVIYGISFDAIMHKLHELDIINDSKYKTYCIRKNQNEALKRFVEDSCYNEAFSTKFETMVYAAAAKDLISTSKAAGLLHSSVGTIRKHLNVI